MSIPSFPHLEDIAGEFEFTASRSSGPGGQNVNKVNSKVTLRWDIGKSQKITDDQKEVIIRKLASKITNGDILIITVQEDRSQSQNKAGAIEKLTTLLARAFAPVKKRNPTKPGKGAKAKRLNTKKLLGEKKKWRKRPE